MTLEVDPTKVWETAYIDMPTTAEKFSDSARTLLGDGLNFQKITTGGSDSQTTPAGESWLTLYKLTADIIGTTSDNLDDTAVALSKVLKSYVDQDDAAATELNGYLEENGRTGHPAGSEPNRVDKPYDELDDTKTMSELDVIEKEEKEKEEEEKKEKKEKGKD